MNTIKQFAELLQKERVEQLHKDGLACQTNIDNAKTSVKSGRKYTKVDVGGSGAYMVVNSTGGIFGIKAYGVIHFGHKYGTLDTISDWYWGNYRAYPKKFKKDDKVKVNGYEGTVQGYYSDKMVEIRMDSGSIVVDEGDASLYKPLPKIYAGTIEN